MFTGTIYTINQLMSSTDKIKKPKMMGSFISHRNLDLLILNQSHNKIEQYNQEFDILINGKILENPMYGEGVHVDRCLYFQ